MKIFVFRAAIPRQGAQAESGPVTRQMVQDRTRELAAIAGRTPPLVWQVDYEQAKRELTGTWNEEQQEAMLNRAERDSFAAAADGKYRKSLSMPEMTSLAQFHSRPHDDQPTKAPL